MNLAYYLVPTQEKLRGRVSEIDSQNPVDVAVFKRGFPEGTLAGLYADRFESSGIPIERIVVESDLDGPGIEAFFQNSSLTSGNYTSNRGGICECLIGIERAKVYDAIKGSPLVTILEKAVL